MSDLHLYVYDLSKGMAKQFSAMFLGKHFDGVWHTGIVAFGQEWFFGNDGIDSCVPKGTILGEPNEMIHLGKTDLLEDDFLEVIQQLSDSQFKIGSYNLLEHNCNNFSHELATLLVGKGIPQHILDLPKEIMNTSLGPMLRPMLEQAADPIHQLRSGQTPGFARQFTKAAQQAAQSSSSTPMQSSDEVKDMPNTLVLFKPDIDDEFNSLVDHCQDLLKLNDRNLLSEIKEYLQQVEITWSISANHIKCLFEIYSNHVKEINHQVSVLKIFQKIALNKTLAKSIVENNNFENKFLPAIKQTTALDIKYNSLQMLSNVCAHNLVSMQLLKTHQDAIFKELSDFVLTESKCDIEAIIHESSISMFYNLVSAYHLESHLNDSNALSLGCALMERLPKMELSSKSIYHMLCLVRSCLSTSEDMRNLALSMEFDLSKYNGENSDQNNNEAKKADSEKIETIVHNIGDLTNEKH